MPGHGIRILTPVVDDGNLFREAIKSYPEAQKDINLIGVVGSGK